MRVFISICFCLSLVLFAHLTIAGSSERALIAAHLFKIDSSEVGDLVNYDYNPYEGGWISGPGACDGYEQSGHSGIDI